MFQAEIIHHNSVLGKNDGAITEETSSQLVTKHGFIWRQEVNCSSESPLHQRIETSSPVVEITNANTNTILVSYFNAQ
jgi:hypothetical protein